MSRTKAAFLGVISSQLYTVISVVLGFFAVPIIVKHLNSEVYGLSILIFQITAYLGMFDFGLTAGVERYLAGTRDDTDDNKKTISRIISTSMVVYVILAILVVIAGNIFAPFAARLFNAPAKYSDSLHSIISVISVLLGFQLILRAIAGIFFAHQRQFLSNTLSFILVLTNLIFTVVFVFEGYGLWSFAYSQIIVFLINAVLNGYYFRKHYYYVSLTIKNFDFKLVKDMFSFGFALFLTGVAVQVIFQTDRIIIGSFVSLTAVSIYSFASRIPELLSQVLWKVSDNSFPGLVELSKNDDGGSHLKTAHNKIMQLTLSFTTAIFWITIIISSPFIKLWVGQQYFSGLHFVVLVAYLYLIQLTFIHVTSVCLNGLGIAKRISIMALIEAAINVLLSIYFVKKYGISGVVLGTIIGGMLTSFWYIPYLAVKYLKINVVSYLVGLLKPILTCSAFGAILFWLLSNKINQIDNWLFLIIGTMGIALCCFIPVLLINKQLLIELKNKLLSR